MKSFANANVYVEGKGIVKTSISFEDTIKDISSNTLGDIQELPKNCIILPGFIDEHIHGGYGSDAMDGTIDALSNISEGLVKEGVTSFLATTMTQSSENINNALKNAGKFKKEHLAKGAELLGVHLEGPFINETKCGAQPKEYIINPTIEKVKEFCDSSMNTIKIITIAPESDNHFETISYLSNKGIVASCGHSNATYEIVNNASKVGLQSITHTYNAQSAFSHRETGVVGCALLNDNLYAEIICDGIHVSIPAIQLLVKSKPKNKVILITDAMRAKGLGNCESELGGQKVIVKSGEARLENGSLAGSVLTMNNAIKNMVEKVGTSIEYAVDCATINPAKNLGLDKEIGSINVGKKANFTIMDSKYNIIQTWINGNRVF